ncbi:MAG: hypothetical protein OEU26_26475, partial [Candidatus Tectomicrobia bacterium]|nr:hypothetical protein [Candidatus Tectomicrobia bacterium]
MAENPINPDQHRADLAELRGELKKEIAGLGQDIVGLTKTIAANQQAMQLRSEVNEQTMQLRFEQVDQQMAADREVMLQQFQQVNQQMARDREVMLQQFRQINQQMARDREVMLQQFQQIDQQFSRHEARLLSHENWMRTIFVTVALVAVGVASQL